MHYFFAVYVLVVLLVESNTTDARLSDPSIVDQAGLSDHSNVDQDGPPSFLEDHDLPPAFTEGVFKRGFKIGRKPKAQKVPKRKAGGDTFEILGLDSKKINLNLTRAERINNYSPEYYETSDDGTYVTDKETGEVIPLTTFFMDDDDSGNEIIFSLDENNTLFYANVNPKEKKQKSKGKKRKRKNMRKKDLPKSQEFERSDEFNILVGYYTTDIDVPLKAKRHGNGKDTIKAGTIKKIPDDAYDEVILDEDIDENEEQQKPSATNGDGRYRKLQNSGKPKTRYGKRCNVYDYLEVVIVTDKKFQEKYPFHQSRAQAIFAEADKIYWNDACIYLWITKYENTVTHKWKWDYSKYIRYAGCGNYGGLDVLTNEARRTKKGVNRDAMHVFSGWTTVDDNIGCAYGDSCRDKWWGYGVEYMGELSTLRTQAVLFAHELGHNLKLEHTVGRYDVMGDSWTAPQGFATFQETILKKEVLWTSQCGYW